ncbi:MAG: biopolymer transporter ExbD [Verrucomicrobia bacterium]|nr:biopolymer transporter ExbD [Verrucomicrobiota bacterium]
MRPALALPARPQLFAAPAARKRARIEIIPLIDIMFFLLASFMLVSLSMVRLQCLQMLLPGRTPPPRWPTESNPPVCLVQLLADGTLAVVDGAERSVRTPAELLAELQQRSAAAAAQRLELRVFLRADKDAPHGRVIELLGEIRALGLQRVTFSLRPGTLPPL